MNRIRFALAATMLLGAVYAAFGLIISLRDFGIGIAVAATAFLLYGLCDFIENRRRTRDEWLKEYRELVWARRDVEAGQQWWIDK